MVTMLDDRVTMPPIVAPPLFHPSDRLSCGLVPLEFIVIGHALFPPMGWGQRLYITSSGRNMAEAEAVKEGDEGAIARATRRVLGGPRERRALASMRRARSAFTLLPISWPHR
jgi:hypothetical protein